MNQIADILKLANAAQQQNTDAVLATVVRTEGSAYRRAGAMMLICEDGRSVGMISGGCLEPHIIKRTFWLTRNGTNVQVYQTGDDIEYAENGHAQALVSEDNFDIDKQSDDLDNSDELNFGLGCNGRVHVLFERLATAIPLLNVISQVRDTQQPIKVATLIRSTIHSNDHKNSSSEIQIGMRINLNDYANSAHITTPDINDLNNKQFLNSRNIENAVKTLSASDVSNKNAQYIKVNDENAITEWLVQQIQPQIRLLICGAGNDVMPLVTMAKLQDWHVTVVDSRAQYATRLRFPQADKVMALALDDSDTLLTLSKNAAVALMSHSLSQDRARLNILLAHANHYQYLGQLGPSYRTERLIKEIGANHKNPDTLNFGISKLHYPIGYKLGGDGPEALALGIMAQINAVMNNPDLLAEDSDTHFLNPHLKCSSSIDAPSKKEASKNKASTNSHVAMSLS